MPARGPRTLLAAPDHRLRLQMPPRGRGIGGRGPTEEEPLSNSDAWVAALMPASESLEVVMTANCPGCGRSMRVCPEAASGLDQDCRVWPMMACVACLDSGACGYWGHRSDGETIPVRPLRQ
jgi:ferredoxin